MRCSRMRRQSPPPGAPRQPSLVDQLVDEIDRAQLRRLRGVEGDLVGPAHDLAGVHRHLGAVARIDLHDQQILGCGRPDERQQGRIVAVAAVPIGVALDLDRAKQERQAGRGHHDLGGDLLARPNTRGSPVRTLVAEMKRPVASARIRSKSTNARSAPSAG